jgi:probable F420-dependent oxidoreductase
MTVSFSTRAPNSDYLGFVASPEAIVAAAKKAEEVGFEAIFVNDHVIVGADARSAPWTNVYDPFVSMSFIAAHTSRIGVGVSVLIMPYRNPIPTAKALATLDLMSGGRVVVGVGVGWNEAESKALAVPFNERGARTNEYLRLWQACWAPGLVSFDGKFFSFADMHVNPKPVQQPQPPIWIGGFSDAALRRAARYAAVWQPTPMPIDQLVERRAALAEACEAAGRAPIPTRMSFRVEFSNIPGNTPPADKRPAGHGTPAEVAADILRYRETGLDAFQINFHGNRHLDDLLASMECFMSEVKPKVT